MEPETRSCTSTPLFPLIKWWFGMSILVSLLACVFFLKDVFLFLREVVLSRPFQNDPDNRFLYVSVRHYSSWFPSHDCCNASIIRHRSILLLLSPSFPSNKHYFQVIHNFKGAQRAVTFQREIHKRSVGDVPLISGVLFYVITDFSFFSPFF